MTFISQCRCCSRDHLHAVLAVLPVFFLFMLHTTLAQPAAVTADLTSPSESRPWTVAAAAPSPYHAPYETPRLHFGVMSIPLWGHFKPLWAVAEELAYRGHTVTVFVEEPSWCLSLLQHSRHPVAHFAVNLSADAYAHNEKHPNNAFDIHCFIVPHHPEVFGAATFQPMTREGSSVALSFVRLFDDLFRHHEASLGEYLHATRAVHERHQPFTTILCDIVTYSCSAAAQKLNVPVVHSYPFTTQLSVGLHPLLPAVGLGLPRHMTLLQQTKNFAFKLLSLLAAKKIVRRLNSVRSDHGVEPLRDAYELAGMYAPLITSTLWGLDIPQPLCSNVHPVGPLNTRDQRQPYRRHDLSPDLADFLDRCPKGVVYVNWGTLSVPTASMENMLFEGLAAATPYCIVWKRHSALNTTRAEPSPARFFVTAWLSSPMAVLKHPHTLAFVSHCGDTSLHEAVEAAVPIIGVPLFADQADVCQRVVESGIGVQVTQTKVFSAADVLRAVTAVVKSRKEIGLRMRELRTIAAAYGGPSRAADIVETRYYNLLMNRPVQLEQCSHLDGALRLDNILMVWGACMLGMTVFWVCVLCLAARGLRRRLTPRARTAKIFQRTPPPMHAQPPQPPRRARAAPRAPKANKEL